MLPLSNVCEGCTLGGGGEVQEKDGHGVGVCILFPLPPNFTPLCPRGAVTTSNVQ